MKSLLDPGSLEGLVPRQIERGLASGDLQPTATREHRLVDAGIPFSVRVIEGLDRKKRSKSEQARGLDPFLPPYSDDLFVANVSETHVALLNKFPVLQNHLLVVTRAFEPQESLLDAADFAALWACMSELGGLGFYNAGPAAGASQAHKHLQWIPLAAGLPTLPLFSSRDRGFACASAPVAGGASLVEQYRALRSELSLGRAASYNLLLTRERMVVIPRTRHAFEGICTNAMGFAGSLLVRTAEELERVRQLGPLRVLAGVSRPA